MRIEDTPESTAPSFGFLVRNPAHFIALGFGAGLAPFAPGTFGTLVAVPIYMLLRDRLADGPMAAAIVAYLLVGTWAAQVAGRNLGDADHGSIVCDEIVAFLAVLYFVGDAPLHVALAFVVFRFFDIVKPPPIRRVEQALAGGIGVMADDLVAAGYTLLAVAALARLIG